MSVKVLQDPIQELRGTGYGSAVCPRCFKTGKRREYIDALRKDVEEGYGKIPRDEWLKKKEELASISLDSWMTGEDRSLSYQQKIGITRRGYFVMTYSAKCDTCGFEFKRESVERIADADGVADDRPH